MDYKIKIDLGQKANELEEQIISKSLFSQEMINFLVEIDPYDFIDEKLREIRIIIEKMFNEKKFISPTTVCNETNDRRLRDIIVTLAVRNYYGEPDTLYTQFNKYHRMLKLEPDIISLAEMIEKASPEFDEKFE